MENERKTIAKPCETWWLASEKGSQAAFPEPSMLIFLRSSSRTFELRHDMLVIACELKTKALKPLSSERLDSWLMFMHVQAF